MGGSSGITMSMLWVVVEGHDYGGIVVAAVPAHCHTARGIYGREKTTSHGKKEWDQLRTGFARKRLAEKTGLFYPLYPKTLRYQKPNSLTYHWNSDWILITTVNQTGHKSPFSISSAGKMISFGKRTRSRYHQV